ncbi:transcriptional regulator [Vibrio sp. ZSDE26]|uniref:Transcriptional regulator n=1 Tax=Vibrio amylolyticus TaxID=2847292 RepID=A0A9X2BII8_9VIBR|nr:transcriptional regulator [Vibrio amylolyticus]MCK6264170.1 transcriptional regulator [Vibrio amylolyticus]
MNELDSWVIQMESWYQSRKHDQVELLEPLIIAAPNQVWGPTITDMQSKAIACWLDACLRVFEKNRFDASDKAFQYLQLAYSKLQKVACNPMSEFELKDWSMKRIQHLVVLLLEFCNQHSQDKWLQQSQELIEAHIHFMAANDHDNLRNDDHGDQRVQVFH